MRLFRIISTSGNKKQTFPPRCLFLRSATFRCLFFMYYVKYQKLIVILSCKTDTMAEKNWTVVNDTLKGIAGVVGIEVAKTTETISTTDLSHLLSEISQGLIAFLTLYSLIKSIFFTKTH